jgi:S1-C subfamily serine protease
MRYNPAMFSARSPFLTVALALIAVFLVLQLKERISLPDTPSAAAPAGQLFSGGAAPHNLDPSGPEPVLSAPEIYRKVSPSVVSVANNALVRRGFFSFQVYQVEQGSGSGFVWDKEGHIVSNYHVVHKASTITVTFPNGKSFEATVTGVAPDYDLAVLKIQAPPELLRPVEMEKECRLEVGRQVYAIGNPFGLDTTMTTGIISALGRTITSMTERSIHNVIQTDAAINPGNSGGPLLNECGMVIGINTAIISPSGAHAGIGFALPAETMIRVVPQLIQYGYVTRAGLGMQFLPDHMTIAAGVKGVAVYAVYDGTPAARAGMEGMKMSRRGELIFGDIITAVNAVPVETIEDLQAVLDPLSPGDAVALRLRKEGKVRDLKVALVAER